MLFRELWRRNWALRDGELRRAWADSDLAQDLRDPDSFPRARQKAVADLRTFRLRIDEEPSGLRLRRQDAAMSPLLPVEASERELLNRIRHVLNALDPNRGR